MNTLNGTKEIICLDLNGNKIGEFPSIAKAARSLNLIPLRISDCLNGRLLRVKQYYFVNKEYYDPNKNYSYKFRKALRKFKSKIG